MERYTTLKHRPEFLRVQHRGSKAVSKGFVLQGYQRSKHEADVQGWRVGFTASKRVGNAVHRNRAKRRLRALVHQYMQAMARESVDYVFIARAPATDKDFRLDLQALEKAISELHKKLDRRTNPKNGDASSRMRSETTAIRKQVGHDAASNRY